MIAHTQADPAAVRAMVDRLIRDGFLITLEEGAVNQAADASVKTVIRFTESLTFKGKQPTVNLVTHTYNTGVKLTQKALAELEKTLCRLSSLEKWFVEIVPTPV